MAETVASETSTVHKKSTTVDDLREAHAATYTRPRVLRNFSVENVSSETGKDSQIFVGLPFDELTLHLQDLTNCWPKRVDTRLFALTDNDAVTWIDKPTELTGWLGTKNVKMDFRKDSKSSYTMMPSKAELIDYMQRTVEQFDDVYHLPHHPRFPKAYYTPEADKYQPKKTGYFTNFVDLFSPYSDEDKILIAAFFATPFWNCEPGSRPLFVIEGPPNDPDGGVGVGKSILVDACAALSAFDGGGYIDVPEDKFNQDELKRRIINDYSDARVVRYDNIKKTKMSSAVLESMITTSHISGHGLRHGHRTKPNRFTYVMTFNDASLSKDLASRAVRIRLQRPPEQDPSWKKDLMKLIRTKRVEIISDLLWHLDQRGDAFAGNFRFPDWQQDVLNKFTFGQNLDNYLDNSRQQLNAEPDEVEEIESVVANRLRGYHFYTEAGIGAKFDPEVHNMFIPNNLLVSWLKKDLAQWYADANHIKHKVTNKSKMLRDGRIRPSIRGFLWSADGTDYAHVPAAESHIKELRGAPRKVSAPK